MNVGKRMSDDVRLSLSAKIKGNPPSKDIKSY